jgi:hypothetical protein
MKKVYKYEVMITDRPQAVYVPVGAKIIHVGVQARADSNRVMVFWVEVDDDAQREPRYFAVFGTGAELPHGAEYVGTSQQPELMFVWHLYEVRMQ